MIQLHLFARKSLRLAVLSATVFALALACGCASSGDEQPKARVFADSIDIQYHVPFSMSGSGTFDLLTFNMLDSDSELEGQFRLTTGPEACSYTNAGVVANILMADCDCIKYVSHGNSGGLFAHLHGDNHPKYICSITDEDWSKTVAFTTKWQAHAKFVRESN
jgi:hypothetical protein